jgi:hypothetical protein
MQDQAIKPSRLARVGQPGALDGPRAHEPCSPTAGAAPRWRRPRASLRISARRRRERVDQHRSSGGRPRQSGRSARGPGFHRVRCALTANRRPTSVVLCGVPIAVVGLAVAAAMNRSARARVATGRSISTRSALLALLVAAGLAGGANGARVHLASSIHLSAHAARARARERERERGTSQHLPAVAISVRAH